MIWRHNNPDSKLLVMVASSNPEKSQNRNILSQFEAYWTKNNYSFSSIDLIDLTSLPFVTCMEDKPPEPIKELYELMMKHDNILFFVPEYIWYFNAFFKNILDWLCNTGLDFLKNKAIFILCVSTTEKLVRTGEVGIWNSLYGFGHKKFKYINFNRYVEGKDETERVEKITKQIFFDLI